MFGVLYLVNDRKATASQKGIGRQLPLKKKLLCHCKAGIVSKAVARQSLYVMLAYCRKIIVNKALTCLEYLVNDRIATASQKCVVRQLLLKQIY